jgi:hypothetical protein
VVLSVSRPRWAAPQTVDNGSARWPSVPMTVPARGRVLVPTLSARVCLAARLAARGDQGGQGPRFPEAFPTRQVRHPVVPPPRHHLLEAWLLRLAPCRRRRLTP